MIEPLAHLYSRLLYLANREVDALEQDYDPERARQVARLLRLMDRGIPVDPEGEARR